MMLEEIPSRESRAEITEKHDGAMSEPAAIRLWLRLLSCSTTVEKRLRRRLSDQFGTTLPRFDVLAALARSPGGMTMGELSQALLVSGGNVTALVRQLQQQGYLMMKRAPDDGRSWLVRISKKGRRHFEEVAAAHHRWIGAMFGGMSADHSQSLYELLAELKHSIASETENGD